MFSLGKQKSGKSTFSSTVAIGETCAHNRQSWEALLCRSFFNLWLDVASLNPAVDIGQVEGGLLMGLGYWLSEEILFDRKTGRLTTDGTWEYKPPSVKGR
jgi:hypothetical protein